MNKSPIWIAGITRGHNSSVCLLKDGEIVFSIEEERLSRKKYDGGPLAAMYKILDYTDKLDYLVIAHTQNLYETAGKIDFSGDDIYTGLARKLGLIDRNQNPFDHPQVIDMSHVHHKLHAACAFYRSGFEEAAALIVDGAGTFITMGEGRNSQVVWEVESIYTCSYPNNIFTVHKNIGTSGPVLEHYIDNIDSRVFSEPGRTHSALVTEKAGITKTYEAVTDYCGWSFIEAGKTMGLFPYGSKNDAIPPLFNETQYGNISNRNLIIPNYPNGAYVNKEMFKALSEHSDGDVTLLQSRRDLAYAVQTETQEQVVKLIRKAVELTGHNKVVISGGYGLNCVANYYYLDALKDEGIEIYCEPVSNDSGTAIGAALLKWYEISQDTTVPLQTDTLYLGFEYNYSNDEINAVCEKYNAVVVDASDTDVVELITNKNIVTIFQGRSENGPRALGNRSILYDPTDTNGKDFVNEVKHREYFRPFAGSILEEDVHEWFDLRGMKSSPTMMYAVNCQPGIEEKIPAIIHVDGTCRIQTVNEQQNPLYYRLIKAFKKKTGCPIIFNTSFNLGGEPLVETLDDALWTLSKSDINYLYLPEYGKLISCKSE
jgi:carbamoyltransferase